MKGDVNTVKAKGVWINRIQGRYKTEDEAKQVRCTMRVAINTVKARGKWVNQGLGEFPTQQEASVVGVEIAKNLHVEWFQKDRLGRIRERNSYGNDPRNIEG